MTSVMISTTSMMTIAMIVTMILVTMTTMVVVVMSIPVVVATITTGTDYRTHDSRNKHVHHHSHTGISLI